MFRTSLRRLAQHAEAQGSSAAGQAKSDKGHRKPMIHFLGKEGWKNVGASHKPRPHPAAPKEIVESFDSFLAKSQATPSASSSSSSSSASSSSKPSPAPSSGAKTSQKPVDYEEFWKAPQRLWKPLPMEDGEMEAVMTGGASYITETKAKIA